MGIYNLISFLGIFGLMLFAWVFSKNKHKVNWRAVFLAVALQLLFALFVLSPQKILSFFYYPLTLMMGVPVEDITRVSTLLGERTIVTELVSYQHLSQYIGNGLRTNPRSIIIAAYALCGFSLIASLAIFVSGISALAPKRAKDLSQLGFRALFAATLTCLMTCAVAGVFISSKTSTVLRF